jgi:hypothetical protein
MWALLQHHDIPDCTLRPLVSPCDGQIRFDNTATFFQSRWGLLHHKQAMSWIVITRRDFNENNCEDCYVAFADGYFWPWEWAEVPASAGELGRASAMRVCFGGGGRRYARWPSGVNRVYSRSLARGVNGLVRVELLDWSLAERSVWDWSIDREGLLELSPRTVCGRNFGPRNLNQRRLDR